MSTVDRVPRWLWRLMRVPPQVLFAFGLAPLIGRRLLLLRTIGRKTGKLRVTPLQYDLMGGCYVVGAARGRKTDWVRNIQANPVVEVQSAQGRFTADAEVVTDPARIADFIFQRYQTRPRFVRTLLRVEGFTDEITREGLKPYALKRVMVSLKPR